MSEFQPPAQSHHARSDFRLLICLARTVLRDDDVTRARELLREGIDWDYLLALAERHGLSPLLAHHLTSRFARCVPAPHLSRLREEFQHNTARNLLLATELTRVLDEFGLEGLTAMPYKGPALAQQVYGDLKLRRFVDLDVLVRRRDAKRAGEVLVALGYRPHLALTKAQEAMLPRSECDRIYIREQRNSMLELHWAVVPPFFSLPLKTEDIFANATRLKLRGREVSVPAPEMIAVLLCVNGTKDLWRALETVCAVSELVRSHPDLDWDHIFALAHRARARRMLSVGLRLAGELLDAPLPARVWQAICADRATEKLTAEAKLRLAEDAREPGLWKKLRYRVRARERLRDRVRHCALRLLTPTYHDCTPELPTPLRFLYYGLRPLRLLRREVQGSSAKLVV